MLKLKAMKTIISKSATETKKIAQDLAKKLAVKKSESAAVVIGLFGDLGSGKTTFTQGFAAGLGIKGKVVSPTFILMRRHGNFYHFDCYRIKNYKEILILGWQEIVGNPENIILIEWAEKIKKILPKKIIKINFEHVSANKRKIEIGNI